MKKRLITATRLMVTRMKLGMFDERRKYFIHQFHTKYAIPMNIESFHWKPLRDHGSLGQVRTHSSADKTR